MRVVKRNLKIIQYLNFHSIIYHNKSINKLSNSYGTPYGLCLILKMVRD